MSQVCGVRRSDGAASFGLLRSFSRLKRQRCFPESQGLGVGFREPDVPIITQHMDRMDPDDIFGMDRAPAGLGRTVLRVAAQFAGQCSHVS